MKKTTIPSINFLAKLLFSFCFMVLLSNTIWSQTTVFSDNFDRGSLVIPITSGGSPSITYTTVTTSTGSAMANTITSRTNLTSGSDYALQILSANSNSTPVAQTFGQTYITGSLNSYSAPFDKILDQNPGNVIWTFNMRTNRATALSLNGFQNASSSWGSAVVLASTSSTLQNAGNGYAVIETRGTGSTNTIKLISYTGGLQGTQVVIASSSNLSTLTSWASVKVIYNPSLSTNNWQLLVRDDTTTINPDFSTLTTSSGTGSDSNYTSSSSTLTHFGFYANHDASNNGSTSNSFYYDNFSVVVNTLTVGALSGGNFANQCINTSTTKTFTLSGTNLTSNVTIGAVSGYTYALNGSSTFTTSIVLTPVSGSLSSFSPIQVRFTPTAVQSYSTTIPISGGLAPTVNLAVAGVGINTIATTATVAADTITSTSATLNGIYIPGGCSGAITVNGFEYSTASFTGGSATSLAAIGSTSPFNSGANLSGLLPNTTYYFRSKITDANGSTVVYGNELNFTTSAISTPVATAATIIKSSEFNANFSSVVGASNYLLDVYTIGGITENIVGWTFPSSGTILTADITSTNNTTNTISLSSGSISNATGVSTQAASGSTWTTSGGKYWEIQFNTRGYNVIKVSSAQNSTSSGPRDFKIQYKIGLDGTYVDVPSGIITVANNYTTGVLTNLVLPSFCDNQSSVYLRWLPNSATGVDGNAFTSGGINRIDNVIISGDKINFATGYNAANVNSSPQLVTGLNSNSIYYYSVRANSTNSTSVNSNVINLTTKIDQSLADFRSKANGVFSDFSTWDYYDGTAWISATQAPTNNNTITILVNHEVSLSNNFVINSGKICTVNGTIDLSGKIISGTGTFLLSSGATLKLGDNISIATGITTTSKTFDAAANYYYNGTIPQTTASLPEPVTGIVTITNSSGVNLSVNKIINSPGSLVVSSIGQISFGFNGNATSIRGTGNFNASSGCTLVISSKNGIANDGTTGNIRLTGTRIFGSGINYNFTRFENSSSKMGASFLTEIASINNLTINNFENVILPARDIIINGTLNFVSGKIETGSQKLILAALGNVIGGGTGWVIGNFQKYIATSTSAITYEIGDATNYRPINLNFASVTSAGDLTASVSQTAGLHPQNSSSALNTTKIVNRYYTLSGSGVVYSSYNATFNYLTSDIINYPATDSNNFIVGKYNNPSWSYPTVGTKTAASTEATGLTSFGEFAIGYERITPVVTVINGTPYTYNTFVQGPDSISTLTPTPTVTYSYEGVNGTIYDASSIKPKKAGDYTVTATVAADVNYFTANSGAIPFTINKFDLTITGATSSNKEYDTTTAATISGGSLVGILGADDVLLIQEGTFPSKNVGINLVVTSVCRLAGDDALNYSIIQPTVPNASITQKEVTIINLATADKVYDKTNTAIVSIVPATELQGEFPSDTAKVSFTPSGYYASATVGNWTITSTTVLTGSESGNYILTQPIFTEKKDITPIGLDVTGITADNKAYDGNTDAVINAAGATLSGVLALETVTLNTTIATGTFDTKDFGNGKVVTISGLSISGANAANYSINPTTTSANITKRAVTITATSQTKCAGGAFSSLGNLNVDFTKDYNVAGDILSVTVSVIGGDGSISGSYPLRPSLATPGASNYTITYIDGTLTVNQSPTATISGTVNTCLGTSPVVTFTGANGSGTTGLGGTLQYEFTYKVGAGGTPTTITSVAGSATTFIVAPTTAIGSINYILISVRDLVSGCSNASTPGTATVTTGICTQIRPTQCGQFVPTIDTVIQASPVPGATQYRFEITLTTAPNTVTVYTWPNYYFNPTTVLGNGGLAYGKEYSIRVKPFIGAAEYPYGGACIVKAPLAPPTPALTTTVRPTQCGKILPQLSTVVQASPVSTATRYEFRVTDANGTRPIVSSTTNGFNILTGLVGGAVYDTDYFIEVQCFTGVGGVTPLTTWGAGCIVRTPSLPFSKLVTSQCNKTVTNLTSTLYASTVFLAEGYRFRVRLQSNPLSSRVVEKTSGNMSALTAAELSGGYAASTVYLVDVAVKYNGLWQEAYGGDVCTITTPTARMNTNSVESIFNVKAFPNPFASHFSLDIVSSSDALVEMKVYDMIGRQLEAKQATVSELSTREIGRNYPSGVYNVVVSQGDKVKSIRMVKR
ncbi:YDG domain-containing protein [Flavobacterium luteum]|uniref:T9SS type A sorting domain-containing protein n=1 Tax=Flavobacterium luteum TaxID=2026654 RepID=A0A7J5ABK0_9FLAO|nr:YDG domain-containing protein [Flavobacterium luteum]KAB1154936.1 T9SS type A sorting domain-containing protein [Flavobacterium luteum]